MKAITSLSALVLGASLASVALAQTEAASDTTPPPAEAGAGAAAAVSGGGSEAPAGDQPADAAEAAPVALAEGQTTLPNGQDITPETEENGRWLNADGIPTYKIAEDGAVDFATFNGYRRYSAECHVCHGPDGEGSTYAPALKDSVLRMDYYDFQQVVASGKQAVNAAQNQVMPAFGTNKNVWCYVDDIYSYLLARGTGEIPRGRPAKRADKTEAYTEQENACMSM